MKMISFKLLGAFLASSAALAADLPTGPDPRLIQLDKTSLENLAEQSGLLNEVARRGPGPNKVTIAILDNGFFGHKKAVGRTLPANTTYHPGPVAVLEAAEEAHGLKMAEIVAAHLTQAGVKFDLHLYSAFGFSNLSNAVNQVIQLKPDIVLYPQVWEYGGNPDGTGFINQVVRRATDAGIKWINAAGNFGRNLYQAPVERIADDWAYLPGPNSSVQFRCHKNSSGSCMVRSVLSWSAFSNDTAIGTEKDLDLVLTDDTLKVLQSAALIQKPAPREGRPLANGESLYPREILEVSVKPGIYYLRVKFRSTGFTKSDYLRLTTSGDFIEQLNRTEGETLLAPSDLSSVITVGANDSNLSAVSRSRQKPEFRIASAVETVGESNSEKSENGIYKGSSNSSAAFTARAAFELSHQPKLNRQDLVQVVRTGRVPVSEVVAGAGSGSGSNSVPGTVPTSALAPPRGLGCFPAAVLRITSPQIRALLRAGNSWVVETSLGVAIVIDEDPFVRAQRVSGPANNIESSANENIGTPILVAWADGTSYGLKKLSTVERVGLENEFRSPQPRFVEIAKAPASFRVCSR
ncbi:MAG: hypothetical protein J0L82_12945 [Deltaproteobacteria bacterium]|nr:hypothetical protein [Deltaproteobacteria bacterium]